MKNPACDSDTGVPVGYRLSSQSRDLRDPGGCTCRIRVKFVVSVQVGSGGQGIWERDPPKEADCKAKGLG